MISRQYMAGFFDGEGCVNFTVTGKNRQVCLRLIIVNTDAEILREINLQFGGRLCKPRVTKSGWKLYRSLVFTGQGAYEFLLSIRPYIIVKRRQADLAIKFWQFQHSNDRCELGHEGRHSWKRRRKPEIISRELEFKQAMHSLNRKGLVQ